MGQTNFVEISQRIRSVSGRLVIVYNPRSSKAQKVELEVLQPARAEFADRLMTYEVLPTDVDDNASRLAGLVQDNDIIITAGGDGTAAIGLNGAVLSGKQVSFYAFPYGNFNDIARMIRKAKPGENLYPLEAIVDGRHFRYAACYFTMGLFAESTQIFDSDKVRKDLQTGKKGLVYSVLQLVEWYFQNRKREFIPKFTLERNWGIARKSIKTTDYMAVNGVSMAKVMRGGKFYDDPAEFLGVTGAFESLLRLGLFMARSILYRVPGKRTKLDRVIFSEPSNVEIQAEGEYRKLEMVREIVFKKSDKSIKIL